MAQTIPAQEGAATLPPVEPALPHEMTALRQKASSGIAAAQFRIGLAFELGQSVPQNYRLAAYWYRKAADQGDPAAQNDLGLMYGKGRGVSLDPTESVKWFFRAAIQGHAAAHTILGSPTPAAKELPRTK